MPPILKEALERQAAGCDGYNGCLTGDVSSTLGVNCGVSIGRNGIVLNDQGGNRIDVTENVTATLRAEAHHHPCVMESAGFCTEHSAKARSIGFEKEVSPTLRAGTVPAAVYENHGQDTRFNGPLDTAPTVVATYGMGGNNQPFVVEQCYDVRFTSEGTKNARQNCYKTDVARTIDTGGNAPDSNQGGVAVAYGICSKNSNSMKSDNPHSGFYEADTSRCLDANGGNPSCNQGGMAVVAVQDSLIGRADKNGPQGSGVNEEVSFTLNTADRHAVAYCMTTGSYIQVLKEQSPTLLSRDYKDPPVVNDTSDNAEYIVRRLTPTECAKLQGFPEDWHKSVINAKGKEMPDSAAYKGYGNAVATVCAEYPIQGIYEILSKEKTQ